MQVYMCNDRKIRMKDGHPRDMYSSCVYVHIALVRCVVGDFSFPFLIHFSDGLRLQELIRLMGLSGWLVWLGWFFYSFIIILLVSSIMTFFLKMELIPTEDGSGYLPPILAYTDPFFVWILFLLYGISSIVFCFAISTFFSKRE